MARAKRNAPRWYAAPALLAPANVGEQSGSRLRGSRGPVGLVILAIPLVRLRPHAQFSQQIPRALDHPRRLLQVGFKLRSLASGEIEEAAYPLDQPIVQVVILHDGRMRSGQIRLRPIQTDAPWNSGIPAQPAPRS